MKDYNTAKEQALLRFDRSYLKRLFREAGGNISEAARTAGVDRTTIYRLMERTGMTREQLTQG